MALSDKWLGHSLHLHVLPTLCPGQQADMAHHMPLWLPCLLQAVTYYSKPFSFLNLGMLAYVGDDQALTEVWPQCSAAPVPAPHLRLPWVPARRNLKLRPACLSTHPPPGALPALQIALPFTTIKLSGQFAFLVWKSVYITKQVSPQRRDICLCGRPGGRGKIATALSRSPCVDGLLFGRSVR